MASGNEEESAKMETRATRNSRIIEELRKQIVELNLASTRNESEKHILRSELVFSESENEKLRAHLDTLKSDLDQSELDKKTFKSQLDRSESENLMLRSEVNGLKDSFQLERDGLGKDKLEIEKYSKRTSNEDGLSSMICFTDSNRVVNQLKEGVHKLEIALERSDEEYDDKKKLEFHNYIFMLSEMLVSADNSRKSVYRSVAELERVTRVAEHLTTSVLSSIHLVTNKTVIPSEPKGQGFWEVYNSYDDEKKKDFKVLMGFVLFLPIFSIVILCYMLFQAKVQ